MAHTHTHTHIWHTHTHMAHTSECKAAFAFAFDAYSICCCIQLDSIQQQEQLRMPCRQPCHTPLLHDPCPPPLATLYIVHHPRHTQRAVTSICHFNLSSTASRRCASDTLPCPCPLPVVLPLAPYPLALFAIMSRLYKYRTKHWAGITATLLLRLRRRRISARITLRLPSQVAGTLGLGLALRRSRLRVGAS